MSFRSRQRPRALVVALASLAFAGLADVASAQDPVETPQAPPAELVGPCVTAQLGTASPDTLTGTAESDLIKGVGHGDRLRGLEATDCLVGGKGRDILVGGAGQDRLIGGVAGDRFLARDGSRDLVRCGPGHDVARLDRRDRASHCERVSRRAPKGESSDDDSTTPPDDDTGDDPCEFGSFSATNQPGACWRPYGDSSPFNHGVTSSPPLVSNSSSIVNRTLNFGAAGDRGGTWFRGGIADSGSDYDHPLYYSRAGDPEYTVHCRKWVSSCELDGVKVRIPAGARPAGGTDAHLAVIDQAAGWEYDMWETESRSPSGGTLYIGHGGMTKIGTADADGLGTNATAAHFGLAAGVIRPEELAAGEIDHALFMVVKCTNGHYVWPAEGPGVGRSCSSIGLSNANAPALGQHFYLDMTDGAIDALSVPEWKKTVLHAMATYGMFVGDTGSDYLGWSIFVQSGSSYTSFGQTDPWVKLAKQYGIPSSGGAYNFDLANTISWENRLRVADPCVTQGTC